MPERDDDDASNPDLTPAPAPAPQPASSSPAGRLPEDGGPPPPADDVAYVTEPVIEFELSPTSVKGKATTQGASLLPAVLLAVLGAFLWAAGSTAPGITLMLLGLLISAVWHYAVGRKTNNQRKRD